MTKIHCVVIGQTGIVLSQSFDVNSVKNYKFAIVTTRSMIPEVNVIVYLINPTGEVIYDRSLITFKDMLPNKVSFIFLLVRNVMN